MLRASGNQCVLILALTVLLLLLLPLMSRSVPCVEEGEAVWHCASPHTLV